ncbi:MAG: YihY/virulence factor BrkB family protein [Sphingopyxis sp.]
MALRGWFHKIAETRAWRVLARTLLGTYHDGFIHAGNLAYLALIALFPFFITATALMSAFGRTTEGVHALEVVLALMPPGVAATLDGPIRGVLAARNGPLLWLGGAIGLWTVASLIETLRDILRRAYGSRSSRGFWHYRFFSFGLVVGAVMLLLLSFSLQVLTLAIEQVMTRYLPANVAGWGELALTRGISVLGLFLALFLLFLSLTPPEYRGRKYPKWPGAALTTFWWLGVTALLPPLLARMLAYDLTYGSLAGVMVTLFFFYLIGLGMVIGAEYNAALAGTPAHSPTRIGMVNREIHDEMEQSE